jgi:transposase
MLRASTVSSICTVCGRTWQRARLREEVHVNLAYRSFCRSGLDGDAPETHLTFSKDRHDRFPDSDVLQQVFKTVVRRCMTEGWLAVRASLSMPV